MNKIPSLDIHFPKDVLSGEMSPKWQVYLGTTDRNGLDIKDGPPRGINFFSYKLIGVENVSVKICEK